MPQLTSRKPLPLRAGVMRNLLGAPIKAAPHQIPSQGGLHHCRQGRSDFLLAQIGVQTGFQVIARS